MNHFSLQAKELWRKVWNIYIWKRNRIGPLKKILSREENGQHKKLLLVMKGNTLQDEYGSVS